MSDQGAQPQPQPDVTLGELMQEIGRAALNAARDSSMATDPREVRELGQGALAFAQAYVILDPSRLQGGDTPGARVDATPAAAEAPQGGVQ